MLNFQNNMPRGAVGMNRGGGMFQAQLQTIMAQMDALRAELQVLLNQLAALQEPIPPGPKASPAAHQAFQHQLADYRSQLQRLMSKINEAKARLAALEGKLKKLPAAIATDLAKLAEAKRRAQEHLRQIETQATAVAGRKGDLRVITAKATIEGIQVAYLALVLGSNSGVSQSTPVNGSNTAPPSGMGLPLS